ncbi:unnamed protein product [Nesidiocoris tenuis]|uniref:Uncharacterized protein n=1 Tax=Nesidiocoris tenuis TaxID=355587 RepID=A0A6H5H2D0_9HEMI|nr:unnamed protein product [Nesidiocoris tenuis]CAB0011278.1 unnamed protein product [Nesidiocoris tenuis]
MKRLSLQNTSIQRESVGNFLRIMNPSFPNLRFFWPFSRSRRKHRSIFEIDPNTSIFSNEGRIIGHTNSCSENDSDLTTTAAVVVSLVYTNWDSLEIRAIAEVAGISLAQSAEASFVPGARYSFLGKAKLVKGGKTAGKSLQEPISPSLLFLTRRMGIHTVRSSPSSPYCALFQGPDLHPLRRSPSRSRVTYFAADTRQQQQPSRKAHSGNISHQQLLIPEFVHHRFNY